MYEERLARLESIVTNLRVSRLEDAMVKLGTPTANPWGQAKALLRWGDSPPPAPSPGPGELPETYVEGFHDPQVVRKMKYRPMGKTGRRLSILGLGASSLGGCFRDNVDDNESVKVVHEAIKSGINVIDTAPWYGQGKSETVLGIALKNIPRQAYYIHTKVGRYSPEPLEMLDFTPERVTRSIDESLERLGLDYIDLIQVHDPEFAPNPDIIALQTLPALIKAKEAGKVRMVGMTGYPLDVQRYIIEKAMANGIWVDASLTYCHYSLNDVSLLESFLPWCESHGIACMNASPISMGLLSTRGPPSWHPALDHQKQSCADAAGYCESRGVDISKLGMHFSLRCEKIPMTLVSTASLKRCKSNIAAVYESLSQNEEQVMAEVILKFFQPLKGKETWEGKEVAQYFEMVAKAYLCESKYGDRFATGGKLSTN